MRVELNKLDQQLRLVVSLCISFAATNNLVPMLLTLSLRICSLMTRFGARNLVQFIIFAVNLIVVQTITFYFQRPLIKDESQDSLYKIRIKKNPENTFSDAMVAEF